MFWLLRIELIEALGCRELAAFFKNALILHGVVAQPIDYAIFILIFFSVQLRSI